MNSNSPEVRALVQAMADKLMQVSAVCDCTGVHVSSRECQISFTNN
jgi:hypothetical protein